MEIYLVRHTTPKIDKGICYGQSDLDVAETFEAEAGIIAGQLKNIPLRVHSSPLQRCYTLAATLFPGQDIQTNDALKELHCGHWELQPWDAINQDELQPWMQDFVHTVIPGGESYEQLYERVITAFEAIVAIHEPAVIVTHGGVIRSILSYITHTPLKQSFDAFKISYGSVFRLIKRDHEWHYTEVKPKK